MTKRSSAGRILPILGVTLLLLMPVACQRQDKAAAAPPVEEDTSHTWDYDRGPISVHISVDRQEMTIAQRLKLTCAVELSEEYDLAMPLLSPDATQFAIVSMSDGKPSLGDGGIVAYSRTYVLEPFLSGEYTIPELTFAFHEGDDDSTHELVTDPVTITVKSLLPEDVEKLALRDVSSPLTPPRPRSTPLFWSLGGVFVVVAGAAFWWVRRRSRRQREQIEYLPAHEVAFDALNALIEEHLLDRGEIELFYVKLSGILRRYIEDRYHIRAPEQTTEEFLFAAGESEAITAEQRLLLQRFLTHCDLVKFAEFSPEDEDIQNTFDLCRDFIESTRNPEVKVVAPPVEV